MSRQTQPNRAPLTHTVSAGPEDRPRNLPEEKEGTRSFWCDLYCSTGRAGDDCPREDVPKKTADSPDCGRGADAEDMAAEMRVLVLLSIGRTAVLLLCVVIGALLCFRCSPPGGGRRARRAPPARRENTRQDARPS